ncbi:MAG: biopolymer transporter ExbD [Kiritimatiellae bacterium]|jgi:biopolymer transport protein ExbD|nr:biopolymer transporter ExbD [Kiritimatiellia bacterium]
MARRTPLNRNRQISEINMTPLLDLTFLLLITFIITVPLIEQGIQVRLPKGKGKASAMEQPNTCSITLDEQGAIFLDNVPIADEVLAAELLAKAQTDPDVTILVRADERLAYGKVVAVMRLLHDADISRMALVTAPEP